MKGAGLNMACEKLSRRKESTQESLSEFEANEYL